MAATGSASGSRVRVSVTCGEDGRTHQVDEIMLTAAMAAGSNRIAALCGRSIIAAALAGPPGAACLLCAAVVAAPTHGRRRRGRHHISRSA